MARHESSAGLWSALAVALPVTVTAVVAGMVKIPPFFANRDIQHALDTTLREVEPIQDDGSILAAINIHLQEVKVSRFWVENDRQMQALDMRLTGQEVTITRDGNRSLTVDATYTQQMWVPLLNRIDEQTYHVHSEAQNKRL